MNAHTTIAKPRGRAAKAAPPPAAASKPGTGIWTDQRTEHLRTFWEAGHSAGQIAEKLGGITRNAVIRKAHQLDLQARPESPVATAAEAPRAPNSIVPSSPEPIPLRLLRRATENVRHTRIDEDIEQLADDIEAHGLLQSLIGYRDSFEPTCIEIVGGGRRLQALRILRSRALLDDDFPVPVLIRDQDDAIELSLAENLQQRTMSPVDEFFAFQALMERGTQSTADLAKRFGFKERIIKQRLRLAQLDSEILDALAARELTLDAAMAYATTSDRHVQRDTFKKLAKKRHGAGKSSADEIRHAISTDTQTEAWPLFKFVSRRIYEREGGGYEEGLFDIDAAADGKRRLDNAFIVVTQAHQLIDFQMLRLLPQWADELELGDQVTGFVKVKDLTFGKYAMAYHGIDKQAPNGYAWVGNDYNPDRVARMLKTIRNNRILVQLPVGVNDDGELIRITKGFFVPKDQVRAIDPPVEQSVAYHHPTSEERAAVERAAAIARHARRLAVGPFAGTPFKGRALWIVGGSEGRAGVHDGAAGWFVPINIFVSDAAIAAQAAAAAELVDQEQQEQLAAQQRADQLSAMEPPAIVVVDGLPWERGDDGAYSPIDELEEGWFSSWTDLVTNLEPAELGATFATREAFDEAIAGAIAADEVPV
ncbi:ParB/RepB/Spo0J family partition protein [uncultured Sphingomonas sp.]|uniref:ParB/RepB/Spo0J family partition protein n=1 Tax=uncultured Sphingomonas sp. TaxID=158754 RepID=UPI0035CAD7AB